MARNWETQATNWQAADADYLDGRIRDDATPDDNTGTVINTVLHGDIFQFFLKQLRDAGITPNGNFDNESNGYQLDEALIAKIMAQFTTPEGITAIVNAVTNSDLFNRIRVGTLTAQTGVSLANSQVVEYQSFLLVYATFTITSTTKDDPGATLFTWGTDFPAAALTWRFTSVNESQQNSAGAFLAVNINSRTIILDVSTGESPRNIQHRFHTTIPIK